MIEERVSDGSMLRLIGKWIKVGVIEDGRLLVSETGTGQGQPISPLLANIYLHYVLDKWFEEVVKPRLKGEAYEIRFADDAILCFQHKEDAERVLKVLAERFEKFGLTLYPEKTRLIEFGRDAERKARRQGKKPETFGFLGFTGTTRLTSAALRLGRVPRLCSNCYCCALLQSHRRRLGSPRKHNCRVIPCPDGIHKGFGRCS
jgi:hypothetical protein